MSRSENRMSIRIALEDTQKCHSSRCRPVNEKVTAYDSIIGMYDTTKVTYMS